MDAIKFNNVYKVYRLYEDDKKRFLGLFSKNIKCVRKIAANYLTFTIKKGERVAVIGPNGAGKSTLLKMMTDVCYPNEGTITMNGKVAALLELSAGFDGEFTGRENIFLKCQLLGMSKQETEDVLQSIIDFADIGSYIDQPIRMYSSGMKARLGFAVIIHSKPDILLIDEALSVGDNNFKDKCLEKIKEISQNNNVTLVFVTHSLSQAKEFCERGLVLNKGHLVYDAPIDEAINEYKKLF